MKSGLYLKLSVNGIKKNKKLYLPYLITCICMVMMFYLIDYLAVSPQFAKIKGGDTMQMILGFGSGVISIFSLILLYYTNSFLIRRRQREFGLYHILGMGKIDLVKIMVLENLIISVLTIAGGIVGGILFSKLGELLAAKILGSNAGLSMKISVPALVATALLFLVIFALIMLRMIVSVYRLKPVELLRSEKTGEKPPKANWIFAVLGLLLLGVAYYLSLTIKDPLVAMIWFMVAVVLVILATYLLFIAGSVTFCKIMQKKKGYYYKTNHFVSLSSMIYRMKRNGAGLASICILSTMVLVMVSSTTSLYLSMEHGLNLRYPKSVQIEMYTKPEQTEEMKENQNGQIIELADRFPLRYFADAYGLDYYAAYPGCADAAEPSAATVAFLIDKVRAEGIPVVFTIELSNGKLADTICEATGAKKLEFATCHNVTAQAFADGATYLQLMERNVQALREALN